MLNRVYSLSYLIFYVVFTIDIDPWILEIFYLPVYQKQINKNI